jgi:NAD(P)-dependent dehydrogenase (short-subunit alcohol dehydrogenase family)
MENKIILTGCNGQLGLAISELLMEKGVHILGIDLDDLSKNTYLSEYQKLDITDEIEVSSFWRNISDVYGLINNAGIGVFTDSLTRTKSDFMKVLEVNLWGTFNMIKGYVNNYKRQANHRVVNIASLYGHVSSDFRIYGESGRNNSEVYTASKSGVIGLTKYCSVNYLPFGFQINSVSPGGIKRNQSIDFQVNYSRKQPEGRLADAVEIAEVVNWTILDSPVYLNGEDILVDYGFSKN